MMNDNNIFRIFLSILIYLILITRAEYLFASFLLIDLLNKLIFFQIMKKKTIKYIYHLYISMLL